MYLSHWFIPFSYWLVTNPLYRKRALGSFNVLNLHQLYGHNRELLVNHANACLEGIIWVLKTDFLAIDVDLAGIASGLGNDVHPEQDIHQGRLAGTILSDKTEDLAAVQVEGDIGQDPVSKVFFGNALHFQQRLLFGHLYHLLSMKCFRIQPPNSTCKRISRELFEPKAPSHHAHMDSSHGRLRSPRHPTASLTPLSFERETMTIRKQKKRRWGISPSA